jgi:hypothetical protein
VYAGMRPIDAMKTRAPAVGAQRDVSSRSTGIGTV